MTMLSRRDAILRGFLTIGALSRDNGITVKELSGVLSLKVNNHDYRCAQTYIDVASTVLPVVEIGERHSEGSVTGRKSTVYGLMQGEK